MDSSRSILFDQSVGGQTHDQNEKTIDETIADTIDETNSGQNDSQSAETIAEQRIGALDDTIDNPIDDTTSGQPESRSDDNTVPIVNDIDDNSTEIGINSNANIVDKNDGTVGDTTGDIFGDQSDDSVDHRLVIDIDRDSHNRVVSVVQSVIDTTVHSDTDTVQHYRVSDIGADYSNPIIAVNDTNDDNGLSVNEANNGIPINTDTDGQCLGTTSAETSDNTQLRTPTRIQSTTGLPESPTLEDLDSLNDEMFALAVNKLGTCGRNFGKWMTRFSNASAKCIEMASSQMSGRVSTSIDNFIAEPMDDTDVSMDQSGDEYLDNRDTGNKRKRMNSGVQVLSILVDY
ncbi:uncharacterized protein LOC128952268 [Oppia nitens]|uniref:uncharacterized protein LOC128952268 n=1 Tax=Oppia nitens TaxID=1686743 RepID=UPI0023DCE074|nr:uncharacterized protein LOC128952268 [Oppia nitens]